MLYYDMPGLVVNGREWSFMGGSYVTETAGRRTIYTELFGYDALRRVPVHVNPPQPSNDNKDDI